MTVEMYEAQGSGREAACNGVVAPLRDFPHPFWGFLSQAHQKSGIRGLQPLDIFPHPPSV